jgi:hypothetical protein
MHFVHLQETPTVLNSSNVAQKFKSKVSSKTEGKLLAVGPCKIKKKVRAERWELISIILATQEPEIIKVWSQPEQIVPETLSQKYSIQNRAGRMAQAVAYLPSKHEALSLKP